MIVRVLQPRQLQQIVDHPLQMDAFGQHLLVVFIDFGGILDDMIVQGLQRAADDRDRRAQFVGDARDEILAHLIQFGAFLRGFRQLSARISMLAASEPISSFWMIPVWAS